VSPPSVRRILSVVDKALPESLYDLSEIPKIFIISVPLPRQESMEGMVKIVIPLSVKAIPAPRSRMDETHIVEIAFGNDNDPAAEGLCLPAKSLPESRQDVLSAEVKDAVDGVYSEAIDMIFRHPI
jgi:hypothetical protein